MKKVLLLSFLSFLLCDISAFGSHIVGGEILITHIQNFEYELRMNIYRDQVGIGLPNTAQITAYRRGNGTGAPQQVGTWTLPRLADSVVPPQTPGCQNSIITIERHYYADTVTLSPTTFNHPSGYLFIWQSCCRNANISNGGANGGATTMTLFPPVVDQAGTQIINSTPQLFPPISEYGCTSQLFYVDFGGVDPDGDSLAYVMYTPFEDGALTPGIVDPLHSPYAAPSTMIGAIAWNPTYNANDAIHGWSGPPDPAVDRLQVDVNSGQLRVTPRIPGNHLFGMWCREFRDINGDGVKELVGSVYRDYQMPIVNNCPPPDTLDGPFGQDSLGTVLGPGDTLFIPGISSKRSASFKIWDSNFDPLDPVGQNAFFSVKAVNFADSLVELNPAQHSFTSQFDTVEISVEFGPCASSGPVPYELRIVTAKGHCPLPFPDSTSWFFFVDAIPNAPAVTEPTEVRYNTDFYDFSNPDTLYFDIRPNWTIEFDMMTIDSTFDTLYQRIEGEGFSYVDAGMEFYNDLESDTLKGKDTLMATFRWTPDCQFFAAGGGTVNLITIDRYCSDNVIVKPMVFNIIEDNAPPSIVGTVGSHPDTTEELVLPKDQVFRKRVGERLVFDYESSDPDRDKVHIFYLYEDLDEIQTRSFLLDLGISTGRTQNNFGDSVMNSSFTWYNREINCDAYEEFGNNPLQLWVMVTDSSCLYAKDSTLLTIEIHDGINPELTVVDVEGNVIPRNGNDVSISFREEDLAFTVYAIDRDSTEIEAFEFEVDEVQMAVAPDGFDFEEKGMELDEKLPPLYVPQLDSVPFFWDPACEDRNAQALTIHFTVKDKSCNLLSDSIALEVEPETELIFPNIITANGDGVNDRLEIIKPSQRCGFEAVRIYNRWGNLVFESDDSEFQFTADNLPAGDYFYEMRFQNRSVTQTLKVMK